ncbi:hypothetical protein LP420_22585 [Massilia sp. B-10]|nr:hypothetical protein LP420_22585 [Massilia sp. B-10]
MFKADVNTMRRRDPAPGTAQVPRQDRSDQESGADEHGDRQALPGPDRPVESGG